MARPRKYTINESYFDTTTENVSYLIGLIMADGTIRPDRFSLTLKCEDAQFLSRISLEIGSNRPIQYVVHPAGRVARLVVNSRKMSDRLQYFGIHSPRMLTARTHPSMLLNRDYWRGIIDGDGSICSSKRGGKIIRLVGSYHVCMDFLIFCRVHNIGKFVSVCKHKSIFTVCLNGKEAISLASLLYSEADLFLPRKMDRYLNWIGVDANVTN